MKPGSIVECVDASNFYYMIPLKEKTYYTVRAVRETDQCVSGFGIAVEGIVNPVAKTGREMFYKGSRFREIEFPPNLEAEIKECLTKELELI